MRGMEKCVCVRARACGCQHVGALSHVQLFVTPQMVACQAPLSMGFSRQEYWSGVPFPTQRDFPNPAMEPAPLMSPALAGGFFTNCTTWGNKDLTKYLEILYNPYN